MKIKAADPGRVIPKKFYVAMPFDANPEYRDHHLLQGIANGVLEGIRGISETAEIIMQWYGIARDAVLVMDGPELVKLNNLSRVQYHNPEYFLSNNMAALRRILDSKDDKYYPRHVAGVVFDYVLTYVGSPAKAKSGEAPVKEFIDKFTKHVTDLQKAWKSFLNESGEHATDPEDAKYMLRQTSLDTSEVTYLLDKVCASILESMDAILDRIGRSELETKSVGYYFRELEQTGTLNNFDDAFKQSDEAIEYAMSSYGDIEAARLSHLMDSLVTIIEDIRGMAELRDELLQITDNYAKMSQLRYKLQDSGVRDFFEETFGSPEAKKAQTVKALAAVFYAKDKERKSRKLDIDLPTWEQIIRGGLQRLGKIYSSEGEWIVKDKKLIIPKGSVLFISKPEDRVPEDVKQRYAAGEPTGADLFLWRFELERSKLLEDTIKDLGFAKRYRVMRIDQKKFDEARSKWHVRPKKVAASDNGKEDDEPLPDDMLEALKMVDDGFTNEEETSEVEKRLQGYPKVKIGLIDKVLDDTFIVDDKIVEYDDGYVKIMSLEDWLGNEDHLRDLVADALAEKFSADFMEYPGKLYHATPSESIKSIMKNGLRAESRTRGLTNRSVGHAIFTTDDLDNVSDSYGDAVIEIDTAAMKADGVQFSVEMEPAVFELEAYDVIASSIGLDAHGFSTGGDGADDPSTVILHVGNVDPKYLKVIRSSEVEDDEDESVDASVSTGDVHWKIISPDTMYIPPTDFLRLTATSPDSSAIKQKRVKEYADLMKSGQEFEVPSLGVQKYRDGAAVQWHDGRHRALAALSLGVKTIPVQIDVDGDAEAPDMRKLLSGEPVAWTSQYAEDADDNEDFPSDSDVMIRNMNGG